MNLKARNLHRDLGYFYIGLIISFALSGILMNHRDQFHAEKYNVETKNIEVKLPKKEAITEDFAKNIIKTLYNTVSGKKIAFLGDIDHPEAGLRYAGYLRAHREAGITPDARLRQSVLFGEPMLLNVVQDWLSQDLVTDRLRVWTERFAAPDPAMRVLLAEALYRAVSVIKGLPYHRA